MEHKIETIKKLMNIASKMEQEDALEFKKKRIKGTEPDSQKSETQGVE